MRKSISRFALFGVAAFGLAACGREHDTTVGGRNLGRFAGVGVFDAGRLWGEMTGSSAPFKAKAARIADDEHVIVVVDTHSGEVRECGDHSGYCVSIQPWSGAAQNAPVPLAKHAADLAADNSAEAAPDDNGGGAAQPSPASPAKAGAQP